MNEALCMSAFFALRVQIPCDPEMTNIYLTVISSNIEKQCNQFQMTVCLSEDTYRGLILLSIWHLSVTKI